MVFVLLAIGVSAMVITIIKEAIWPPPPMESFSSLSFGWKCAIVAFFICSVLPYILVTPSDATLILKMAWLAVTGERI